MAVVAVLGVLSQRRLQRVESRFKSKSEDKSRLQADETNDSYTEQNRGDGEVN